MVLRCFLSHRFTFPKGNKRNPEGFLLRSRIRESSDQQMHALTRGISQLATPFFVFQAKPSTIQRERVGWLHYRRTPTQPMHDDHHKREHSLATSFNQHLHADLHLKLGHANTSCCVCPNSLLACATSTIRRKRTDSQRICFF